MDPAEPMVPVLVPPLAIGTEATVPSTPAAVLVTMPAVLRPENVMVPLEVMPVSPETTPAPVISQTLELIVTLSPLSPRVTAPLAVSVPFEVNPLVAVISPEMVGVAVQDVGEMVKDDPAIVVA